MRTWERGEKQNYQMATDFLISYTASKNHSFNFMHQTKTQVNLNEVSTNRLKH